MASDADRMKIHREMGEHAFRDELNRLAGHNAGYGSFIVASVLLEAATRLARAEDALRAIHAVTSIHMHQPSE